mmetsp:Transcript_48627/g.135874  ORF Transcript_48627/g.135874 Transcript_48627/m.135874 type:complete len:369 (-) Transcript_48627:19-1125(-)
MLSCRCCGGCCAFLVGIVAVLAGSFHAGKLNFLARGLAVLPYFSGMSPTYYGDKPWRYEYSQLPRLDGKVAIVTGANAGVGFWTALHLARQGAHVFVCCRSPAKCADAVELIKANTTDAKLEPAIVDMSNLASVRRFAQDFKEKHTRLDIFVANAGIGSSTAELLTADNIEPIFATNHVGHQLLYMLLEDLIVAAGGLTGDARVVVVSSCEHFRSAQGVMLTRAALNERYANSPALLSYAQSKLANVLFAQEVARRMDSKPVFANSLHPGAVNTTIWGKGAKPISTLPFKVRVRSAIVNYLKESMWTAEEGALTQVYLAAASEVREQRIRGRYFHPQAVEVFPHAHARNFTLQKAVWAFTEDLIAGRG